MKLKQSIRFGTGLLSIVLLGSLTWAADVTSLAMPSTQEGGTARAMSMGSAVVGLPQGTASLFWNPAGLGGLDLMEIGVHHNSGLGESIQEIVVFGMPAGNLGGFAVSLNYTDSGTFEGRDAAGNLVGSYTATDMGANLGWGKQLFPRVSVGVAVKYNQQTLANKTYNAFAVDAGVLWNPITQLNLGLTYSNLGTIVAGSLLDSVWRIGASYDIDKDILVTASGELKNDGFSSVQGGLEGYIDPNVALRAGYVYNITDSKLEGLTGLTAGIGVAVMKNMMFDYAFVPYGELGSSHRLSLTYKFAGAEKEVKP